MAYFEMSVVTILIGMTIQVQSGKSCSIELMAGIYNGFVWIWFNSERSRKHWIMQISHRYVLHRCCSGDTLIFAGYGHCNAKATTLLCLRIRTLVALYNQNAPQSEPKLPKTLADHYYRSSCNFVEMNRFRLLLHYVSSLCEQK